MSQLNSTRAFAAAIIGLATLSACSNAHTAKSVDTDETSESFMTDSIHVNDTLVMGGCNATAKISGLYPTGDDCLSDSVRKWIADRLRYGLSETGTPLFELHDGVYDNGDSLIRLECDLLLADARQDFSSFIADSISVSYEYDFRFSPAYTTDSILTYSFGSYVYLGGAHGGATGCGQTFARSTGDMLDSGNMFLTDSLPALLSMVKSGLWNQYFKDDIDGSDMTLRDVLLINPDTLHLPAFPPVYLQEGINFTYQQYEIACYAAGMPSCTISYDSIRPLLTPKAAALIPKP